VTTIYGNLVPQYGKAQYGERQKKYRSSISYYENGSIKSIALEKQIQVKTPIGIFDAELLTFYDDGSLKRLFPLNGKIDGFWSEEDEGSLCKTYEFKLQDLSIEAKIIGVNFYRKGALKSISLWPGEEVEVLRKDTLIKVRNGLSFYEDGRLKSIEPAIKTMVKTPIGNMYAYDKDAIGIHGDVNSLTFSRKGDIIGLISSHSGIKVNKKNSEITQWMEPMIVDSLIDDDEKTILPLKIQFNKDVIQVRNDVLHTFEVKEFDFKVYLPMLSEPMLCSSCSNCTSCS
jgi:antitoxin component YwqK of YwqJK toxin-antitoxin module